MAEADSMSDSYSNSNKHVSHRTIVICLDGTGDKFDEDNTNVVNFFSLLTKGNPTQLVYYQPGIGTYTVPRVVAPLKAESQKVMDKMFAHTFEHHVMDAYKFLMENYELSDKICIFGFSRGAHTARALAGMITKVGLLPAGNHQQVDFAYKLYMDTTDSGWDASLLFKKTFSMSVNVKVEFVGVWDTVDSVGLEPHYIPFVKNNFCVKTFRHALALDEHRVNFNPYCEDVQASEYEEWYRKNARCGARTGRVQTDIESTDVLEVWFSGCHSDVGGGSVDNATRFSLARIPLRWMIRQCYITDSGIQFDKERLHMIGFDSRRLKSGPPFTALQNPRHLTAQEVAARPEADVDSTENHYLDWRVRLGNQDAKIKCEKCDLIDYEMENHIIDHQRGKSCQYERDVYVDEEHEELHDALSPIFDQLRKPKKFWFYFYWLLEILPRRQLGDDGKNTWHLIPNLGRPRSLPKNLMHDEKFKVHRSVKTRKEAASRLLRQQQLGNLRRQHQYEPRLQLGDLKLENKHYVD